MKKIFCCPALELFCCLPLWKTVLFVSSRAFLLSTPTFLLSTPVENSEATLKKATKCIKNHLIPLRRSARGEIIVEENEKGWLTMSHMIEIVWQLIIARFSKLNQG